MGQTETDIIEQNTPGPWSYEVSTNDPDYFEVRCHDCTIALVDRWQEDGASDDLTEQAEANAALIATAPDLLDDLEFWLLTLYEYSSIILERNQASAALEARIRRTEAVIGKVAI